MIETWKDIKGYEGLYQVSNLGRVKSLERYRTSMLKNQKQTKINERILRGNVRKGYVSVVLSKQGFSKGFNVHRLVATAFIPNNEGGHYINHIDGNKQNNIVSNLEWCTCSENAKHAYQTGLKKPSTKKKLKLYEVNEIRESKGVYQKDLAKKYGVSQQTISKIINRERWGND